MFIFTESHYKIYWTEGGITAGNDTDGAIMSGNFDGSGVTILVSGQSFPQGIDIIVTSALSVELIIFTGIRVGEKVRLDWKTETETNNDYFEVQRSINGFNFEIQGIVNGSGTSIASQEYRFWDESLPRHNETLYYRLKQVDLDGHYEYTDVVAINNRKLVDDISIYPNPAIHQVVIESSSNIERMRLYTSEGRLVLEKKNETVSNKTSLSVSKLPKGLYLIRINENYIRELVID